MKNDDIENIERRLQLDYVAIHLIGACFLSVGFFQLLNYHNIVTFNLLEIYILLIIGVILHLIYGWIIYIKKDA